MPDVDYLKENMAAARGIVVPDPLSDKVALELQFLLETNSELMVEWVAFANRGAQRGIEIAKICPPGAWLEHLQLIQKGQYKDVQDLLIETLGAEHPLIVDKENDRKKMHKLLSEHNPELADVITEERNLEMSNEVYLN